MAEDTPFEGLPIMPIPERIAKCEALIELHKEGGPVRTRLESTLAELREELERLP